MVSAMAGASTIEACGQRLAGCSVARHAHWSLVAISADRRTNFDCQPTLLLARSHQSWTKAALRRPVAAANNCWQTMGACMTP